VPQKKPLTSREITVTFGLKKLLAPALAMLGIIVIAIVAWRLFLLKEEFPPPPDKPSIAVLPFVDLSPQKDQEYFCDGMTDEIIAKLSRLEGWKVISRTSMMRYKGTDKDITAIAQELDVATILEGSIGKERDDIRVNAKLIRAADSIPLWSETYEKKMDSVFSIQGDVAAQIARALEVELSPEEKERLKKKPTENLTAYDYYLQGREYYNRYLIQDNERAIELFRKALEYDPDFALAHAGLGDSYCQRVQRFGYPRKWLDEAIEASKKAISLDPGLSEGYKALGLAYFRKGWYQEGIIAGQKAVELNPNNLQAIGNLGWDYFLIGEFDEAMRWFKKQYTLAPTMAYSFYQVGALYYALTDFSQAEEWMNKALEIQPDLWAVRVWLSNCYLAQGKYNDAAEQSKALLSMTPITPRALNSVARVELFSSNYEKAQQYYEESYAINSGRASGVRLGYLYWRKGEKDKAQDLLNQILINCQNELEKGHEGWSFRLDIARIHAILDNKDKAYKWLQEVIDAGWTYYPITLRAPLFERLHEDERFKQMMAEVKAKVDEMRSRVEEP
jgi:TolB-like protein/Flp pilus assembly protein TadD